MQRKTVSEHESNHEKEHCDTIVPPSILDSFLGWVRRNKIKAILIGAFLWLLDRILDPIWFNMSSFRHYPFVVAVIIGIVAGYFVFSYTYKFILIVLPLPMPAVSPQETVQTTPPQSLSHPTATQPKKRFTIRKIKIAWVNYADSVFRFTLDDQGNCPAVTPFNPGPTVRVIEGDFSISALISDGYQTVQMLDNVITLPPEWDANQDENAVEIIDGHGQPIFQLIVGNNTNATIYGIFVGVGGKGVLCAGPSGLRSLDEGQKHPLTPIFKYSSEVFDGQRVSQPSK